MHGNQKGRHFHGCSYCYLPLYIVQDDLILCSRLRPANVDPAAGAEEELARERNRWPETVVRGDGGPRRDVVRRQRSRRPVVPQRPPDGAQATAQVAPPLRLDRRGVAAVLQLPLPDPNVVEPDAAGSREGGMAAGSSRRPLRRDFPGLQAGGENRIKERQLDLFADRTSTSTMRANRLRLDFATFASRLAAAIRRDGLAGTGEDRAQTGSDETSQGRRLHFGPEGSALVFVGLALEGSVRPGSGEPAGTAGPDSPFSKAGTPATGQVCSGAPRRRSRPQPQTFAFGSRKPLLADRALLPRPAGRSENRVGNPDLASGFALVRYAE